jgi:hypothetical protein
MKVMIKDEKVEQGSLYLNAGAPKQCFLPTCRKPFSEACVHGEDGHYYCSFVCADEARKVDLSGVEELSRRRA